MTVTRFRSLGPKLRLVNGVSLSILLILVGTIAWADAPDPNHVPDTASATADPRVAEPAPMAVGVACEDPTPPRVAEPAAPSAPSSLAADGRPALNVAPEPVATAGDPCLDCYSTWQACFRGCKGPPPDLVCMQHCGDELRACGQANNCCPPYTYCDP